jgi:hypothetical protein
VSNDRLRLEKLRREVLWRRSRADKKFFMRNFWSIKVPGVGRQLFVLRDAQDQAFDHWEEHRYSLTLKARQIGWSTGVTAFCWHEAYFEPDREILFVSKGEREAQMLLNKAKYGMAFLPEWMRQRGPRLVNDSKELMEFDNGSMLRSLPSASDPARSFSGYRVVVDEWAFLQNPEQAWASIEPVADVGGRITGLSTANGYGNFFHDLWVGAETGVNQFKTMFHDWRAGGRDDDWYAVKKRSLPEWQLAQEYPDNPEEAFLKSGNPVFDLEQLHEMGKRIMTPRIGILTREPV